MGKKVKEIMVDIECFGTGVCPVIASIGAVKFNLDTGECGDEFYVNISSEDQLAIGCEVDHDTLKWWAQQSQEARDRLFNPEPMPLNEALDAFAKFCKKHDLWGNGVNFDNRIIRAVYKKAGRTCPFHFRDDRDVRTLVGLGRRLGINPKNKSKFKGTQHDALDDCKFQVGYCHQVWEAVKKHSGKLKVGM